MSTVRTLSLVVLFFALFIQSGCGNSQNSQQPPPTFIIGGQAINLVANSGLALQNNGGDTLAVGANGQFHFLTALQSGAAYNVTISSQPSNPAQTCSVTNGTGNAMGNVSDIQVDCGHHEWTWVTGSQSVNQIGTYGTQGTASAANTPGGRQYPATWTDSSGTLWLFGGYGYDSQGNLLPFNDMWKFSGGQWTWVGGPTLAGNNGVYGTIGVASPANLPGARFEPAAWTDSAGNFWMFGGNGFDSVGNESPMNDLWKYSNGEWTWMGGTSVGLQQGVYGTQGVASSTNLPGGRSGATTWLDSSGTVWLFGGIGYDESNPINGELNDLWKYSNGQWTWVAGPKTKLQPGVYGSQGVPSSSTIPGARWGAASWLDSSGNLWLFGGYGYDSVGNISVLNDFWKYSAGQWTWISGATVVNQRGIYGTQNTAAAGNIPGARFFGVSWTDAQGNFWLFAGNGFDSNGSPGWMNDLWEFRTGAWVWVSGSSIVNQFSVFGTPGSPAPGNIPSARFFLARWLDPHGNLWLFGGYGESSGSLGNLNDLWMYEP